MDYLSLLDKNLYNLIFSRFNNKGGVYRLHSLDKNRNPVIINRFLGNDDQGVLYIGMTQTFVDRVIELKKTILKEFDTDTHIAGRRYYEIKKIESVFSNNNLFVSLIPSDNPEELEKKMLSDYEQTFGELPPLNRY